MNDTSPEIKKIVREKLMALSGAQRFIMGAAMFESARQMVLASFPKDLSDLELKQRLFERFYGRPLFPK